MRQRRVKQTNSTGKACLSFGVSGTCVLPRLPADRRHDGHLVFDAIENDDECGPH